jgi:hypothetical protein
LLAFTMAVTVVWNLAAIEAMVSPERTLYVRCVADGVGVGDTAALADGAAGDDDATAEGEGEGDADADARARADAEPPDEGDGLRCVVAPSRGLVRAITKIRSATTMTPMSRACPPDRGEPMLIAGRRCAASTVTGTPLPAGQSPPSPGVDRLRCWSADSAAANVTHVAWSGTRHSWRCFCAEGCAAGSTAQQRRSREAWALDHEASSDRRKGQTPSACARPGSWVRGWTRLLVRSSRGLCALGLIGSRIPLPLDHPTATEAGLGTAAPAG